MTPSKFSGFIFFFLERQIRKVIHLAPNPTCICLSPIELPICYFSTQLFSKILYRISPTWLCQVLFLPFIILVEKPQLPVNDCKNGFHWSECSSLKSANWHPWGKGLLIIKHCHNPNQWEITAEARINLNCSDRKQFTALKELLL